MIKYILRVDTRMAIMCSTARNFSWSTMVTQANHNRDPILNFYMYYTVLRRPSQYSTTQNHSCSLMVVRAITVRPTALLHMNLILLYYEDRHCVAQLKPFLAQKW